MKTMLWQKYMGNQRIHRKDDFDCASGKGVKLDEATALAILMADGSHREIAAKFGVVHTTVGGIKRGQIWRHLYMRVILGKDVRVFYGSHLLAKNFDECYIPEPNSGCWLWIGNWGNRNYGRCSTRKNQFAHRDSYIRHVGPIPDGMFVCHKCDTPPCVNPDHLFLGTHEENMRDMVNKKRSPIGPNNPSSIFTEGQIRYIRSSTQSQHKLAKEMGCRQSTISRIKNGVRWGYLK